MTFNASLRLNSAGFKKGVNEVKSALAGLKSSFLSLAGALGAGLGFTQLISQVKDTALQLSVAQNVLKNVSKVTKEYTDGVNRGTIEISNYAENLEYVRNLARTYSQDLIGLTSNFAKFHAACDKTNLSLEAQKDVFEALTRAAAYYHMSADQTNDMTLAITQMMSKGKVSSEELRRQLGNSLPGAFNLMAAAIGVTTAQLEDMMKKGQVISSEALPRFAAMLNTVTKNADFDSLQMSINRLKNTWTELVERSNAEGLFQGVVNGANSILAFITRNINEISSLFKGLVAGLLSTKVFDYLSQRGKAYFEEQKKEARTFLKQIKSWQSEVEKKGNISGAFTLDKTTGGFKMAKGAAPTKQDLDLIIKYNEALYESQTILKNDKITPRSNFYLDEDDLRKLKESTEQMKRMRAEMSSLHTQSNKFFTNLGGGIKSIFRSIKAGLASLGITALIGLIIGALTSVISYIKKIRDEQKRVNGLVDEYTKSIQQANQSVEENSLILQKNLDIMRDESRSATARANALKEINKMMGTSYSTDALDKTKKAYQDIVKEVERWIEATRMQAKIQVLASKAAEAEIEIDKINIRNSELKKEREKVSKGLFNGFKIGKIEIEEGINKKAIEQYNEILRLANKQLEDLQVSWLELVDTSSGGSVGGGGDKETDIEKVVENYNKELKELDNKLKEHAITQEEYNRDFDALVSRFWGEAAGTGKMSIDAILDKMDKGATLSKMEKWYKDLYEAAQRAALNGAAHAAEEAIKNATDEAIEAADKELKEAFDNYAKRAMDNANADFAAITTAKPKRGKRDTTFDYNKTRSTQLEESAGLSSNYAKDLEDAINTITSKYDKLSDAADAVKRKLAEWREELNIAKKEAATLEEAMKFAKIQEDIDNLKKGINEAAFGGIKNLASSLDRIIKGMETLRSVFEDSDSTGWEKFIAIFNQLVQIIETIMSAYQTLQTIQSATAKLDEAEIALTSAKISLLERELLLRQAIAATKASNVKQTEAQAAANLAEAATAKASASAKAGEAIAGATASGAKLAFPYNLAAIAAGVAAVIAALASMSKFAKGGIVGGNSYSGDKQMARVNAGEMILNRAQQRTLWDIVNGKKGVNGGNVQFTIRGADLVGTLNNYNRLRK